MTASKHNHYYNHLRSRSALASLYRNFLLYPKLHWYLHGKILDIGCGLGDFLNYCKRAEGVDINPLAVEFCLSRGLSAHLMEKDTLPFKDSSFDSIVMDNVIEHIENPKKLLSEISRVLKVGGVLIIGVPGALGFLSDPDHKIFYDEDSLTFLVEKFEFKRKDIFYMPIMKSTWLSKSFRQYCIYSIFIKIANNKKLFD